MDIRCPKCSGCLELVRGGIVDGMSYINEPYLRCLNCGKMVNRKLNQNKISHIPLSKTRPFKGVKIRRMK